MDVKSVISILIILMFYTGLSEANRRRFHRRGPHMCGPLTKLRCCPGWIAAPFSNLCIHKCRYPHCDNHRFSENSLNNGPRMKRSASSINNQRIGGSRHLIGRSRRIGIPSKTPHQHKPSYTFVTQEHIPKPRINRNPRRFFRPHISNSNGGPKLPKFGFRTVSDLHSPQALKPGNYVGRHKESISKWRSYYKSKKNQTKVIRRRYDKTGRLVVIKDDNKMNGQRTITTTESGLRQELATTMEPIASTKASAFKMLQDQVWRHKKRTSVRPKQKRQRSRKSRKTSRTRHRKKLRAGRRRRKQKPRFVPPIGFQGDQPFLDLRLPEDELILEDLKSTVVDLPGSNSTDLTITESNSTLESLGVICRGDLCLQKQRLLNYNLTNLKNLLDPSEVECPKGYFKAVREGIIVCEAYRESVQKPKRNKKKNKNRRKKKVQTTLATVIDENTKTGSSKSTTTNLELVTDPSVQVSGTQCPPGQVRSQRGDLGVCLDIPLSTPPPIPDYGPDVYSQACPRRQRTVYKNGVTFCADENDYGVCDTDQEPKERDGILFCEDTVSTKVEIVSKLPPSSSEVPENTTTEQPCSPGQVLINEESGTVCVTPPDADVSTSVESAKTGTVCVNGADAVIENGKLVCKDQDIYEEILPINGACPEHFILTRIEGKSICRKDVLSPKDGICPVRYTLHRISGEPVCVFDYPESSNEGIATIDGQCPSGFIVVESNGKEICKLSVANEDFVRPRRGQCPDGYVLITRDRELVCKREDNFDGSVVFTELPEDGMCPLNYHLAFLSDKPVCIKSNQDVLPPINGQCPQGYVLLSSKEKVICKKEPASTSDCLRSEQLVEENGHKVCKSILDLPPDLNCPPGYRTYEGICEEEELLRILFEPDEEIQCPEGQVLTEKNNRFFCESPTIVDLDEPIRPGGCSENQIPVQQNGEVICVDSEERRRPQPSTTEPPVYCAPGERVIIRDGEALCQPSRGDIDISIEVDETSTQGVNVPICLTGAREVTIFGRTQCKSDEELCSDGQKIVEKDGKIFCENSEGITVQIYPEVTPPCPTDTIVVIKDGEVVCRGKTSVPDCPQDQIIVIRGDAAFCELSGRINASREIQSTTPSQTIIEEERCPEGKTKIVKDDEVFCEITGTLDSTQRQGDPQTTTYATKIVDLEGERFDDCPEGYAKVPLRNGRFDCELQIKPTARPEEGCPEGYKKVELRGGNFDCEIEEDCAKGFKRVDSPDGTFKCDSETQDCPLGHKKIFFSNGQFDCELDECPEGFRKKWAFNRFICEPERFKQEADLDGEWVDPSLVDCPEGYVRALRDNLLVCQSLRGSVGANINCSSNEILILEATGPRCEIFRCDDDEKLEIIDGVRICRKFITTTPPPVCPSGMEVVRVQSGYICRYIEVTTTTIPTTTITCPDDEILVRAETGLRCIRIQTPRPPTTEAPCPSGMRPLSTGVGIICIFEGGRFSTTTERTSCPDGQILMETADGKPVCGFQITREECERDQLEIFTVDGRRICKNVKDLEPDENPCPVGLFPVVSQNGVECLYTETNVHSVHDPACNPGQILTLTQFGFFCEEMVIDEQLPVCRPNQVVVQTKQALECVDKEVTNLICDEGYHMVKTDSGYFCELYQFDVKKECNEGEIMVIFEKDRICKKLEHNIELCGKGYKAIRTEDGFVCSSVHRPLQCPEGYHLHTGANGKPECFNHTDDQPCLGIDEAPCENGVRLIPCQPGYNVIDGVEGPECELGDFIEVVCSEENECVAESCKTGYGTKTCQDLLQLVLDGCIPQCSNGGRCVNKTCLCPAGVTGSSCEEDINECNDLSDGHCQYGCHNTFGSFQCRCPEGATLNADKRTCKAIGCIPDCMNGGVCLGGYCSCPRGFNGTVCENDVNECRENNGLCEFYCRNTFGGYSCVCPPGSRLRDDGKTCMNTTCIPECKNGGKCENHKCSCPEGFYGIICQIDVNECYQDKPCSHQCINTHGSYRCSCPQWATLSLDRHNCRNITTNIL